MKQEHEIRIGEHRRMDAVEDILKQMEGLLNPAEKLALKDIPQQDLPMVYIVGCARSGTTLAYQYLAASALFAYPTNFLSRFYYAPFIGARLQQLLFDLDVKHEIHSPQSFGFDSKLGKSSGAMAPHEFWYFWRRFFRFGEIQLLNPDELAAVESREFLSELNALQYVFQKPLLMKAMILNFHIPYLYQLYPNCQFVFIERELSYNAQSLLRSRREFYGDERHWYSFKGPAYPEISKEEPLKQVVEQVKETNALIEKGLAAIPAANYIRITHEDFCKKPAALLQELQRRLPLGEVRNAGLPTAFDLHDKQSLSTEEWNKLLSYAGQR